MVGGTDIANNDGRARVIIENVSPQIDGGRFAVKRVVGDVVRVEADAFVDGHDVITCVLRHKHDAAEAWSELAMQPRPNDRFVGEFRVHELGRYSYVVQAWVDRFATFCRDLRKRADAGQDLRVDAEVGALLLDACAEGLSGSEQARLRGAAAVLRADESAAEEKVAAVEDALVRALMHRHAPRPFVSSLRRALPLIVEPWLARAGAWYELFPRSCAPEPGRHGTLRDLAAKLPEIAEMGFDVVYLPPIHPIGRAFRKGKNNAVKAQPDDVGSPWAIGATEGGHKSLHPDLGTMSDFRSLLDSCKRLKLALAMDIAFQCAPDHPYVQEHPEWFRMRPDGSIQYAENPPKKYQDIYPFDFESSAWQPLWKELLSVVLFWAAEGVKVFRVDNPHTKPFRFWEWLIAEVKKKHPDAIFLAEAFTRPKPMYQLAKLGFSQSYNYFPWRNSKQELIDYFTELTRTQVKEFFRPALWPNTPDILPEYLQMGGRAAFICRYILAATLGATYGVYGPAFELCEGEPREPGSEEYKDSEKYQLRFWGNAHGGAFRALIARINRLRHESLALQDNDSLLFHAIDNEQMLCFSKQATEGDDIVLVVANLDPHHKHSGWVELDLAKLGVAEDDAYQVHDVLTDARFLWRGRRNYVELDPQSAPAHVFRLRRRVRSERDFEYFL